MHDLCLRWGWSLHQNYPVPLLISFSGHFDHREKCWLVIWEAGIALELPPGVFVFYPSSLFLHFNIDLSRRYCPILALHPSPWLVIDLPIVTTLNGEKPSKQNSKPLYYCGCNSHEGSQAWAEADGRGSMVWFNQASMFQTSETGFNTLKEAREAGAKDKCDTLSWLDDRNLFPRK